MVTTLPGCTLVRSPAGPLDVVKAAQLRDELLLAAQTGQDVVLDLDGVTTFDVDSLAVIVRAARSIWRRGGSMRIVDPHPHLAAMLTLTGIGLMVPIETPHPGGEARAS